MTKFILHGGVTSRPCESNDNYYREIINSVESPKILLVYFAIAEDRWQEVSDEHKKLFLDKAGDKKIEFTTASKDTEKFIKQIEDNNIIFIRGGSTPMLQTALEKIPKFQELIKNKVIACASAGAIVLAKYYYDQDYDSIFEGLDILHIKLLTHYLSTGEYAATSGEDKLKKLEDYKESLPVYAIKETEYIII